MREKIIERETHTHTNTQKHLQTLTNIETQTKQIKKKNLVNISQG